MNEIRILASISHFNVIKYCDAFVERNNLYIVMEYAEHGDIFRQITKKKEANKYMREEVVWVYFLQICLGLKALHDRNILHRVSRSVRVLPGCLCVLSDMTVLLRCAGHEAKEHIPHGEAPHPHWGFGMFQAH